MKRTMIALLMLAVSACADASGWDALWRNADQRAEQLLRDGDAAGAAKLFTDPRRKAYAEMASGNFAQAAQTLKAIDEPDAHYNRGNALAHAGQLPQALAAYDAALARDPHNQDARRNRDLVAKAQKQNPPQPPHQPEDGQSGAQKKGGQGNDPQAASPSGANGATGPSGPSQQSGQPGDGQANKASDGKDRASGKSAGQTNNAGEAGQADTRAAANQRTAPAQPAGQGATPAPASDSAAEARRDAAAGANTPPAAASGAARPGADAPARLGSAASVPSRSEQQLAQEQWLRSIPDDPGGLLRRKFLIEHLMRQQKSSP